ncbi:MAG: hypothetical protein GTO53_07280, partial [Planctomycetales bacterium]|nr:hypothetical protein [Planctomycetales bacterium]NIM08937.1 hypothetical protein [Planctomycetales bacterium]NIN08407.1 hypothetical protein [Planctomycetales bacterium]NIN77535.1 hypothetical protein [Planctomycetales bacterium]NIO34707.1 hypothetical protein [Planctomycetales bacterium]
AVADNGRLGEEQQLYLIEAGFETEKIDDEKVVVKSLESQLMSWEDADGPPEDGTASTDA